MGSAIYSFETLGPRPKAPKRVMGFVGEGLGAKVWDLTARVQEYYGGS